MTREQALVCADRLFGGYATLKPSEASRSVYADMFERFNPSYGSRLVDAIHVEHDTCPSIGQVLNLHARQNAYLDV